jgi:DNA polymerase-3 subunit beta
MRCQIESKELAGLIDAARPFLPKATTMPVLEYFRLEAKEDCLYCTATDLKIGVTVSAEATVPPGAEGTVLLPGKLFSDLVRSFPSGVKVELEAGKSSCTVLCGKSRTELTVIEQEQYPAPPEQEKDALRFTVPADTLKKALKQVLVVVGGEMWDAVLFDFDGEKVNLVATDSHRLALYEGLVEVKSDPREVVLPADGLEALAKILPDGQAVEVLVGPSLAYFTCGGVRAFTAMLNRSFPKYRQVLPAEPKAGLLADRRELVDALERISLLVDTSRQVRYCLLSLNGSVTLEASSDTGNAYETLSAVETEGEIKIAFNPSYLAKILRVTPEDRVSLRFTEPLRPITVHSEKCLYLVLPVRTPETQQQGGGA